MSNEDLVYADYMQAIEDAIETYSLPPTPITVGFIARVMVWSIENGKNLTIDEIGRQMKRALEAKRRTL